VKSAGSFTHLLRTGRTAGTSLCEALKTHTTLSTFSRITAASAICTGTGNLAIEYSKMLNKSGKVIGSDFCHEMVKLADRYDAVLVGNGITRKADKFCQYFIKKSPKLKVVDADALKSLSFKDFSNTILSPHETELEMMLVNSNKEFLLPKLKASSAKEKAEILQGNLRYFLQNNNVLLVKGATDIIISRNKIAYNRTGNQGMTKAGTGDVLAGLCVGFLAKSQDLFKSAVAASYINGFIADQLLKKKKGYAFIASDIIDDLAKVNKISKKR